jgi:hypothetical protein
MTLPVLVFGEDSDDAADSTVMLPLLKRCLGHSDNDLSFSSSADEVYNWDYGTMQNPHLVKFVLQDDEQVRLCKPGETVPCTDTSPPGFYAPVIYKRNYGNTIDRFVVYSRAASLYPTQNFRVFTTTGYLNRVSYEADVYTTTVAADWTQDHPNVLYTSNRYAAHSSLGTNDALDFTYTRRTLSEWDGGIDCETNPARAKEDCLQKGDWVMFFSVDHGTLHQAVNPERHNIYQVKKIYKADYTTTSEEESRNRIVLNMHTNLYDHLSDVPTDARLIAYKFYPPAREVRYVEQCSGRGLCNSAQGLCECFPGYTNDDCSVQSAGAV